jgi:nitrogen fixation/metabolism regulation signal transduction histidine kinase
VGATDRGEAQFEQEGGRGMHCGFQRLDVGGATDFALVVAAPSAELFAGTDSFARVFWLSIGATVFVLLVWSLAASRAIARPVGDLVDATRRIARGDLEVRVPAGGGRELGELAASFNGMARELEQGRERLAVAEREKAWAEMARQVAHEIKNPLTPMRMAAQLLLRARSENDPRADAVADRLARTVEAQTDELARIADDFRQFAGAPARSRETVVLDEFLRGVASAAEGLFAAGALRVELQPGANAAQVLVDPHEMRRVFVNLLQNAAQAKPGGATVWIASSVDQNVAEVRVRDDGPGLDLAVRERLFEPYFTTKTSGTGLGLAICRRILEAHGGRICLERTGVEGTEFLLELPLAR